MNIELWLHSFKQSWINHDIDSVMEHFSEDIEYWETPFRAIESRQQLRNEWLVIELQQDIEISTSIFSSTVDNNHTVLWELSYVKDDDRQLWSGVYLIKLNDEGKCTYFYQVGERAAL